MGTQHNRDEPYEFDQKEARRRVQLDFSPEAFTRLNNVREKAQVRTNAEAVRNALRVYDWFLDQKAKNATFQVLEGDSVRQVEILL